MNELPKELEEDIEKVVSAAKEMLEKPPTIEQAMLLCRCIRVLSMTNLEEGEVERSAMEIAYCPEFIQEGLRKEAEVFIDIYNVFLETEKNPLYALLSSIHLRAQVMKAKMMNSPLFQEGVRDHVRDSIKKSFPKGGSTKPDKD